MSKHSSHILAISQGDPAGIGPEIIVKVLADNPQLDARCLVFGDPELFEQTADSLNKPIPSNIEAITHSPFDAGSKLSEGPYSGDQAFHSIVAATRSVIAGQAQAIITAPISKRAMQSAGHAYPGHTELLAELAGGEPVRMMLANPELRVVLVTVHEPLAQAIASLNAEQVLETLRISSRSLTQWLGRKPRLAVAGLNPHAGEGGTLGQEEIQIIAPAIAAARAEAIDASGPFPPDTIFMQARGLQRYDAVIAMYHDQGLIPVKYLGVEDGVNVTLGLPFIRTSPDHGTAFDIAGQGIANPDSLLAAIRFADQMHMSEPLSK